MIPKLRNIGLRYRGVSLLNKFCGHRMNTVAEYSGVNAHLINFQWLWINSKNWQSVLAISGYFILSFEKMRKSALRYCVVNLLSKSGGNRMNAVVVLGVNAHRINLQWLWINSKKWLSILVIFGLSIMNFKKMRKTASRYRVVNLLSKFGGNRMNTVVVLGVNAHRINFQWLWINSKKWLSILAIFGLSIFNFEKMRKTPSGIALWTCSANLAVVAWILQYYWGWAHTL